MKSVKKTVKDIVTHLSKDQKEAKTGIKRDTDLKKEAKKLIKKK